MKTHSCVFKMKNNGLHSCLLWPSESFAVVELSVGFILLRIITRFLSLYFAKYISVTHIFVLFLNLLNINVLNGSSTLSEMK